LLTSTEVPLSFVRASLILAAMDKSNRLIIRVQFDGQIAWQDDLQLFKHRGVVRFVASDGSVHEVNEDQIEKAAAIDPGLWILQIM
jgi:hypothetical protein